MLKKEHIMTNCACELYEEAIRRSGRLLVEAGYVDEDYIEGMLARDRVVSTAIGNAIAIPHGTREHMDNVRRTGLVILTYPDPIDWKGEKVNLVIGIAAKSDEHLKVLEKIATAFETEESVQAVAQSGTPESIYQLLS